jgi:hypothetical protein
MQKEESINYKTSVISYANGRKEVVYYETTIVAFDNSEIVLNTGTWWTATTKSRMNLVSQRFNLGYRVLSMKNGAWYVTYQGKTYKYSDVKIRLDRVTGAVEAQQ